MKSGDKVRLIGEKETAIVLWIAPCWKKPPRVILDRRLNNINVYTMDKLERVM
jgi:hypothetical protein